MPTGTMGCEALNISDAVIAQLNDLSHYILHDDYIEQLTVSTGCFTQTIICINGVQTIHETILVLYGELAVACSFISELSKLRKLSVESVENTSSFAEYKKYLHVVRPIEDELCIFL